MGDALAEAGLDVAGLPLASVSGGSASPLAADTATGPAADTARTDS